MAVSTIQKLTSQIHRLPSLSSHILTRSSATLSSSKKVSDRIVKLFAIDPEGQKREVVGLAGQSLLKALTNCGMIDPASHRLEEMDACSAECEGQHRPGMAREASTPYLRRGICVDKELEGSYLEQAFQAYKSQGRAIEDCKKMIAIVDADGDGRVNFMEFKQMMKGGGFAALRSR
ncbi:hypothetical protein V6N11_051368 [Hibiscus sabdariffa]|uniref:EF-hand domain-containing protein n=1 Tax=Hibiscus sabdariffa TaxID=183260 RepID=A0ABR1ZK49_9ROSI